MRRLYGSSPLHLLVLTAGFALAAYAVGGLLERPQAGRVLVWLVGAAVVHDLVLYPVYAAADRGAQLLGRAVDHVRVPALLSGVLLLVWWPTITQHSEGAFSTASGLTMDPFLERWLLLTAGLFLGSGALWLVRRR